MGETVCAVVVTRDRRALLTEALDAVRAQTRPPDHVLVVDNASTDGTPELLRERFPDVEAVRLHVNAGGAGGFAEGVRRAHAAGFDWLWLMDDDTIPAPDALALLLDQRAPAGLPAPSVLVSRVVWTDGTLHPMNRPGVAWKRVDALLDAAERRTGLVPIRYATFPSLLLDRRAVDRHGLPHAHYFLWSDDMEYTGRVLRDEPGYYVAGSVAVHKTRTAHTAVTRSGPLFYFHVRNTLYMLRSAAWTRLEKVGLVRVLATTTVAYLRLRRGDRAALATVARGLADGLRTGAPPAGPLAHP